MADKERFPFDGDFQWEIVKYIILDSRGYKALNLIEDNYFILLSQQVVVSALKKFFKTKSRIPKSPAILKQEIKKLFKSKRFSQVFKEEERDKVLKRVSSLYRAKLKDGDDIFEACKQFASFIQVKQTLEDFDITQFEGYNGAVNKLQKAINVGIEYDEDKGTFLVQGAKVRQIQRSLSEGVYPTPIKQLNHLTNGGGYPKGSLICVIDKGKGGKTNFLVNVGRKYLNMRKKIIVFDLENGERSYADRFDQSCMDISKRDLYSRTYDTRLLKYYRKFSRFGSEVVIRRVPAGVTANQLDNILNEYYRDSGIRFDSAIIDYIGLMGANSGQSDETRRISEAYIDIKNLASKWDFEIVWTGHHITREAMKRRATKYEANDTAKCIDIHRHVDAEFGLNQNKDEEERGVMRLEVIDQRDGVGDGRCYMKVDISHQRMDELSKQEIDNIRELFKAPQRSKQEIDEARASNRDKLKAVTGIG